MLKKISKISFCIPVYNEEKYLIRGLKRIRSGLDRVVGKREYEIIIVDNASSDSTPRILKTLKTKNTLAFRVARKGIGVAYRKAIKKAKFSHIILSAIDLPFGFSDFKNVIQKWSNYDLIFGSKAHPKSKIFTSRKRNIYSFFYRVFLKLLFNIKVKDPQGSVFLKKEKILPILKYCTANNAFFTAQLAIHAYFAGLIITEVPVTMRNRSDRSSKYTLLKDGSQMLVSMMQEFIKLKKQKWLPTSPTPASEAAAGKSSPSKSRSAAP